MMGPGSTSSTRRMALLSRPWLRRRSTTGSLPSTRQRPQRPAGVPSPREKAEFLRRAWELMTERQDDLAALITLENGKALADARSEVVYASEFFRWYSEEVVRIQGTLETAPSGANRILVTHQPVGACLLITPWNFPAAMATRKVAPALAAALRSC